MRNKRPLRGVVRRGLIPQVVAFLAGCSAPARTPRTLADQLAAQLPGYDDVRFYADMSGSDLAHERANSCQAGRARPLRALSDEYVGADLVAQIAARHRSGARLLVVTTNLDAARSVVWNLGAIAASGRPDRVPSGQ